VPEFFEYFSLKGYGSGQGYPELDSSSIPLPYFEHGNIIWTGSGYEESHEKGNYFERTQA